MGDESRAAFSAQQKSVGDEFFDTANFDEAVKFYTNAITLNPCDFTLYGNRSLAYYNLNLYEEALKDAEKALEISPTYLKGHVRKFRSLYKLGRIDEGDDVFSLTCRNFPEYQDEIAAARCESLMEIGGHKKSSQQEVEANTQNPGFFWRMATFFRRNTAPDAKTSNVNRLDRHDSDSTDDSDEDTGAVVTSSPKTDEDELPNRFIRKRETHHQ